VAFLLILKTMKLKNIRLLSILLLLLLMLSCNNNKAGKKTKKSPDPTPTNVSIQVPEFNADSAYFFIEKQISFGPRVPESEAHSNCAEWIKENLQRFCSHVSLQEFKARAYNNQILNGKNIIAVFNPNKQPRYLLCAHWDSRPYADHDPDPANHQKPIDGANDGASGTGVLMEVARQLSLNSPSAGVDIVLFDIEDYGPPQDRQAYESTDFWGLGSQFWSRNPHTTHYSANFGILLDMVGAPDAQFPLEGFSMYYAPDIGKKVWEIAGRLGYGDRFVFDNGGYITDDHYFINRIARIPTINIIHLDQSSSNGSFFEHWHTINDNMDHIDTNTLKMVGDVVLNVVFKGL